MAKDDQWLRNATIANALAPFRGAEWLAKAVLIWDWGYQSTANAVDPLITAHGKVATDRDHDGDGWHEILAITGLHNGDPITGLVPAGESIPGNDSYDGDNRIRFISNREDKAQLSKNGFQYRLKDGSYANVFFGSFFDPPSYVEFHSRYPFPNGAIAPNTEIPVEFVANPDLN